MTILAKNLKKLREHRKLTKEFVASFCGTSQSAVSQWELDGDRAYIPRLDKLMALAGLYKTTVDEMYNNPNLEPCDLLSAGLDSNVLEKVFLTIDNAETLSYAYEKASVKRRVYLFTLLYSLCEEITSNYLDETEVTALMDLKNVTKKRKTITGSRKGAGSRAKPTTRKKH